MSQGSNNGGFSREEFEARLIARAWQDLAFRKALQRDPKAAIREEFGDQTPFHIDNIEVNVFQEEAYKMYVVLPAFPDAAEHHELSDSELEAVAGGTGNTCTDGGCGTSNCTLVCNDSVFGGASLGGSRVSAPAGMQMDMGRMGSWRNQIQYSRFSRGSKLPKL